MFALKSAVKMPKSVQIEWEDGLMASFNYLWLQDNSHKRPDILHLKLNPKPESVKFSKDALNLVWPPYLASDYSSEFLRENAILNSENTEAQIATTSFDLNSNLNESTSDGIVNNEELLFEYSNRCNTTVCGKSTSGAYIWSIVDSDSINPKSVMGQMYWERTTHEPGTVWPHLQKVPGICAIDRLNNNNLARLFLVDSFKALTLLAKKHPSEFEFLAHHVLEYSEGVFRARHPACRVINGKIIPGVFNNVSRSCAITAKPLERLYESLQKFGRVCIETAQLIELPQGKRLLIDNSRAMIGAPAQSNQQFVLKCLS